MLITRLGSTAEGFEYVTENSNPVKDAEIITYINSLKIPPAYTDVIIFYPEDPTIVPKIIFQGYDSKHRLQRIYNPLWRTTADRQKFCELLNFAEQIDNISAAVGKLISGTGASKEKCIAMVIRLVMICYFRIGNKKYQELYGSFGAMNILKKHVKLTVSDDGGPQMDIKFTGKKGILNTCLITDAPLITEIKKILSRIGDNDFVFTYIKDGEVTPLKAIDINDWLKSFDPLITSKDFRTYDANILLIIYLRRLRVPEGMPMNVRKKSMVGALKHISELIHNTPAILKKSYTQSGLVDMYINNSAVFSKYFMDLTKTPKQAMIDYLRDYCTAPSDGAESKSIFVGVGKIQRERKRLEEQKKSDSYIKELGNKINKDVEHIKKKSTIKGGYLIDIF
jgi:DNA topoisomerase I